MTTQKFYRGNRPAIRDDIAQAHAEAWSRLANPGTWWNGEERVAIARETRTAVACEPCESRTAHPQHAVLPQIAVDVIHRVRRAKGNLDPVWYEHSIERGLSDAHYVELIGVLASTIAIDAFTDALRLPRHQLPDPRPGAPSRVRPADAQLGLAWVPTIAPETNTARSLRLYEGKSAANIHRALSLVPDEVAGFFALDDVQYLPDAQLRDFAVEYRSIDHAQIELLAARVSALNQCVY